MINSHCTSEWLTVGLMLKTFLFHKSFLPYIAFFFFFFRTTPRTVTKTFWAYPLFPFFHFLIFLVSCSRLSWHMSVFEHTLKIAYSMALYHMTGSPSEWLTAVSQCVSVCVWSVEWLTAALREWLTAVSHCVCGLCLVSGIGGGRTESAWSESTAAWHGSQHGHQHWRRHVSHCHWPHTLVSLCGWSGHASAVWHSDIKQLTSVFYTEMIHNMPTRSMEVWSQFVSWSSYYFRVWSCFHTVAVPTSV